MKFLILSFVLYSINMFAFEFPKSTNTEKIHNITNYKQIPESKSSEEVFYKVCLDEVVYWVYSSIKSSDTKVGKGGLSIALNGKTLQAQRCKITKRECVEGKRTFEVSRNIKNIYCYKHFKIIE